MTGAFVRLGDRTRLRREDFGVLLYQAGSPQLELLAPAQAAVLAALDGQWGIGEAAEWIEGLFRLGPGEGRACLAGLVERYGSFLLVGDAPLPPAPRRYTPAELVYDAPAWHAGAEVELQRLSAPITMTWVVTTECNFQCRYCYVRARRARGARDALLPAERLVELLAEAADLGVAHFMVTGGEPLLNQAVYPVIRAAIQNGMGVDLNTNGLLLADAGNADRLAATGLDRIVISIDAASPQTQAMLSGTSRRAHGEVLEGISSCLRRGIRVKTNSIVSSVNVRELPALIDSLAALGVPEMAFSHYTGSFKNRDEALFPSLADYEWLASELELARARHPGVVFECSELTSIIADLRRGTAPGPSRCDSIKRGLIILPDGRATFCDTLAGADDYVVGDLRTQSIAQVWAAPKYAELLAPDRSRFAGTACAECDGFDACIARGHCYARALVQFGTGYAPDPFCPIAYDSEHRLF